MVIFPTELAYPYRVDWVNPDSEGLLTCQYDDGTTVTNCITGATGEAFDSANELGTGTGISATWSTGKPVGIDDDPLTLLMSELGEVEAYGLKLDDISQQISITFTGAYDIDVIDVEGVSTNYTGSGVFALDGSTHIHIEEIKGTDTSGFHLFSMDRTKGDTVTSETSSLVATISGFTGDDSQWQPILDKFVTYIGTGLDYNNLADHRIGEKGQGDVIHEAVITENIQLSAEVRYYANEFKHLILKGDVPFNGVLGHADNRSITSDGVMTDSLFQLADKLEIYNIDFESSTGNRVFILDTGAELNLQDFGIYSPNHYGLLVANGKITGKRGKVLADSNSAVYDTNASGVTELLDCDIKGNSDFGAVRNRFGSMHLTNNVIRNINPSSAVTSEPGGLTGSHNVTEDVSHTANGMTQGIQVTLTRDSDDRISETDQAALKGQGWNGSDIVSWAYAPIDSGGDPTDLIFTGTLRQVSFDSITVEFINTLDLKGTVVQPTNDTLGLQSITLLGLGDTIKQPTADTLGLADVSELIISDTVTQPTLDGITITAIKELAVTSNTRQPTTDSVQIEQVSGLVLNDNSRQPAVDTLSIELYTELSFADTLVQVSADTITLTSKTLPQFGKNDIMMIDNSEDYQLTDNSIEYKAK